MTHWHIHVPTYVGPAQVQVQKTRRSEAHGGEVSRPASRQSEVCGGEVVDMGPSCQSIALEAFSASERGLWRRSRRCGAALLRHSLRGGSHVGARPMEAKSSMWGCPVEA